MKNEKSVWLNLNGQMIDKVEFIQDSDMCQLRIKTKENCVILSFNKTTFNLSQFNNEQDIYLSLDSEVFEMKQKPINQN